MNPPLILKPAESTFTLYLKYDFFKATYPTLITVNDKNVVYELKWLKSLAFEAFEGIGVDGVNWRRKPPPDDRT